MPTKFIKCGFEKRVVREDGFYNLTINNRPVGFHLDVRLNYYRGLPVSSIRKMELTVDDSKIPDEKIQLKLNGKIFAISQLKELYREYWGIKVPGELIVYDEPLLPGEHKVRLTVEHRSPYMEFAHGVFGMIDGSAEKILKLQEARELK